MPMSDVDLTTPVLTDLNAVDLTGQQLPGTPYTGATLDMTASASGWVALSGTVAASLELDVQAFEGVSGVAGASIDFSVSATGDLPGFVGVASASLDITTSADGFNDWSAAGVDKDRAIYLLRLGDTDPVTIPISSWQATARKGDMSSYLSATVPAYEPWADAIAARQGERMEIRMGFVFEDGSIRSEPIISGPMQTLTAQSGPRNSTATLSGYARLENEASGAERTLTGIRTTSVTNGKARIRADIDLFLRPGMIVNAAGRTFEASYVNYYATRADRFCEAGQ